MNTFTPFKSFNRFAPFKPFEPVERLSTNKASEKTILTF